MCLYINVLYMYQYGCLFQPKKRPKFACCATPIPVDVVLRTQYTTFMLYLCCTTTQATTCANADAEEGLECGHGDPVSTAVDAGTDRTSNSRVDQV